MDPVRRCVARVGPYLRLLGTLLVIVAGVLAATSGTPELAFGDSGTLRIGSDRAGQPICTDGDLVPGGATTGQVTLSNTGTLRFAYAFVAHGEGGSLWSDPVHGLQLEVRRATDGALLHRGPLAAATGALGTMTPGEAVALELQVSLPATAPADVESQPVTVDFQWVATAAPSQREGCG